MAGIKNKKLSGRPTKESKGRTCSPEYRGVLKTTIHRFFDEATEKCLDESIPENERKIHKEYRNAFKKIIEICNGRQFY